MSISETACLTCALQHNGTVRFRPNLLAAFAASLLAGCTSPNQRSSNAPVWQDMDTVVQPSPVFPVAGPVETNVPQPLRPPATTPKIHSSPVTSAAETWVPLQRWSHANSAGMLVRLSSAPYPAYALQTTNGAFVFHTGSQLSQWDGTEIRLGFAPQLIDGQPYVHFLDLYKTIQPLAYGETTTLGTSPIIVLDPGHGGENSGTRSVLGNHYEKEYTLDWALRLQALLQAANCKVFLTRSTDIDLALSNRVAFAAQHRADLFISLHFNSAAPNEVEAGLETYCLTPVGMPSSLTRGFSDEVREAFPNNAFDVQNLLLALRVHRALLQINGRHDRGIRRARFPGVLRGQQRAAILVEGGYLSNPQEASLIADPAYRQKLAEAVAKALLPPANVINSVALNNSNSKSSPLPAADSVSETPAKETGAGPSDSGAQ